MEPRKAKPSPKVPPPMGQPSSQVWLAGLVGVVAILLLLSVLVA
jgi:hypothetical protein